MIIESNGKVSKLNPLLMCMYIFTSSKQKELREKNFVLKKSKQNSKKNLHQTTRQKKSNFLSLKKAIYKSHKKK